MKHDVFYNAIKYWTDKFHDDIPFFSRFTKAFSLEGLNIILKFNYFYTNNYFFHQIKGTLSGLRQFLITESPLKMMKNGFCFTLKALFVIKIFTFWS